MFTIKVSKELASTINSRESIKYVFDIVQEHSNQDIVLDFSNVSFISRSAAHQLYVMLNEARENKITLQKQSRNVQDMYEVISESQNRPTIKKQTPKIHPTTITSLVLARK